MESSNDINCQKEGDDDMQVDIQFTDNHQTEIWRIISQYLQEKGHTEAANTLQKESGVFLEGAVIQKFRKLVLDGEYDEVVELIHEIEYDVESICKVKRAIFEQKYYELIEKQEIAKALEWLRNELIKATNECANYENTSEEKDLTKMRIMTFSSMIMCKNISEIKDKTGWDGSSGESRSKLLDVLQSYISPQKMIETGKLESLLKQSLKYQVNLCEYHENEKRDHEYSLLEKHSWKKKTSLPNILLETIQNHNDEVWYVSVSPDGKKLASVGKDKLINIWKLEHSAKSISITLDNWIKKAHECSETEISSVMWNKDSNKILTSANNAKIFDVITGEWIKKFEGNSEKLNWAVWMDNDTKVLWSETEKCMILFDVETKNILHTFDSHYYFINLVSCRQNNVVAYYVGSKICILDLDTKNVVKSLDEDDKVREMSMSSDGKYIITNWSNDDPVINLWSIDKGKIIQKYKGHTQDKYVLKCAFGGKFESYIVCGSEDDKIYIWSRSSGELLEALSGHTDTVNTIWWSPLISNFFFSCSDDQTIKVWGTSNDLEVKVHIDPKFKIDSDSIMSEHNGLNEVINQIDDSESMGDSSISDRSLFSEEAEEEN